MKLNKTSRVGFLNTFLDSQAKQPKRKKLEYYLKFLHLMNHQSLKLSLKMILLILTLVK